MRTKFGTNIPFFIYISKFHEGNRTKIIYSYILLFCLSFQLSVLPQILGLQNEILKEDVSAPFQPESGGKIFIS
jgi:hypothetical protein